MILVTRPKDDSILLKKELDKFQIESFVEPLLIPEFYKVNLDTGSELIITSKNAVRALLHNGAPIEEVKICAMTEGIANFALSAGFKYVTNFSCRNVSEFEEKLLTLKGRRFIYLSGLHITEDIISTLSVAGLVIRQEIIYEMKQIENFTSECLNLLNSKKIKIVTLFSKRSAKIFRSLCEMNDINPFDFKYFVLSENIALELQGCEVSVGESQERIIRKILEKQL